MQEEWAGLEGRAGAEQRSKFYRNSLKGNLIKGQPSGQETQDKPKGGHKKKFTSFSLKGTSRPRKVLCG